MSLLRFRARAHPPRPLGGRRRGRVPDRARARRTDAHPPHGLPARSTASSTRSRSRSDRTTSSWAARGGAPGPQGGPRGERVRVPARQPLGDPLQRRGPRGADGQPAPRPGQGDARALPQPARDPLHRRSSPTAARTASAGSSSRTSRARRRARRSSCSAGSARRCAGSRASTRRSPGWCSSDSSAPRRSSPSPSIARSGRSRRSRDLAEEAEATDLSRRVRVSSGGEEFRRLANVINSLFDRLERAFAAQRRLIADAAHELKTPTAVLLGEASDALRPEATESERRRSLQTIAEVSRGVAREVDGLLHLARGDAAAPRRVEPIDLSEIAEEAILAAAALGHHRGVACAFAKNGEARLRGERAGLLRLVSNLVSNAVIYTKPDTMVEVRVGAEDERVPRGRRPRSGHRSRRPRADLRALRPARRRTLARNPQGSGLGLAIVEQVVEAHGGAIEVRENRGRRRGLPGDASRPRLACRAGPPRRPSRRSCRSLSACVTLQR